MRKALLILTLFMAATVVFGEAAEKAAEAAKTEEAKTAEAAKTEEAKTAEAAKTEEAKTAEAAKAEEVKPAEAAKAEEAKPAEEVKPIEPVFPWIVPACAIELEQDMTFRVRAEGIRTTATLKPGEKLTFLLKENVDDCKWIVSALDTRVATVVPTGHEEGGWFSYPVQSFELTAVHPGRTLLEMSFMNKRNAPMRSFRCYIEVK